jgi:hypothetical protein
MLTTSRLSTSTIAENKEDWMTTERAIENRGQIYTLMSKIMADLEPIGKDSKNIQQGYTFRGIDAIYSAFHKVLADNGVFFTPHVSKIEREERPGREGGILAFVTVTVAYTFYAPDGSSIDCSVAGEGMDSGDKATKKAMTAAVKTLLEEVFCIETGEDADSERDDPAPQARQPLKICPECGAQAVIQNQFGPGFYCRACRTKLPTLSDAVREEVRI